MAVLFDVRIHLPINIVFADSNGSNPAPVWPEIGDNASGSCLEPVR